jgi:hypothetical protein
MVAGLTGFEVLASKVEDHQRQLVDDSDPTYKIGIGLLLNPANGSWWILHVRLAGATNVEVRRDLNNPLTTVSGIPHSSFASS